MLLGENATALQRLIRADGTSELVGLAADLPSLGWADAQIVAATEAPMSTLLV
ncbi:hypothetical protein [Devosia sp. CAU 1758]